MSKIIQPQKKLTLQETQALYTATLNSLKWMSVRAHLLGCALHRVDEKNDIFRMDNGILDKEHLYHIRKAIKDGTDEKQRDIARRNFQG